MLPLSHIKKKIMNTVYYFTIVYTKFIGVKACKSVFARRSYNSRYYVSKDIATAEMAYYRDHVLEPIVGSIIAYSVSAEFAPDDIDCTGCYALSVSNVPF